MKVQVYLRILKHGQTDRRIEVKPFPSCWKYINEYIDMCVCVLMFLHKRQNWYYCHNYAVFYHNCFKICIMIIYLIFFLWQVCNVHSNKGLPQNTKKKYVRNMHETCKKLCNKLSFAVGYIYFLYLFRTISWFSLLLFIFIAIYLNLNICYVSVNIYLFLFVLFSYNVWSFASEVI